MRGDPINKSDPTGLAQYQPPDLGSFWKEIQLRLSGSNGRKSDEDNHVAEGAAAVVGGTNVAASGVENGAGKTTIRSDGVISTKGFKGNQYVSATKLSKVGQGIGTATLAVGVVIDASQLNSGKISKAKFAENRMVDGVGLFGGGYGAVAAGAYCGLETFYPGGANKFSSDVNQANIKADEACSCSVATDGFYNTH